jgi:hypothetical protein
MDEDEEKKNKRREMGRLWKSGSRKLQKFKVSVVDPAEGADAAVGDGVDAFGNGDNFSDGGDLQQVAAEVGEGLDVEVVAGDGEAGEADDELLEDEAVDGEADAEDQGYNSDVAGILDEMEDGIVDVDWRDEYLAEQQPNETPAEEFERVLGELDTQMTRDAKRKMCRYAKKHVDERIPINPDRLLAKAPIKVQTRFMGTGKYKHFGVRNGLRFLLRGLNYKKIKVRVLKTFLYVDGVRKFKCGKKKMEFWILLLRVGNVRGLEREVVPVGAFYGSKKPSAKELLRMTIEEFKKLRARGFEWDDRYDAPEREGEIPAKDQKTRVVLHRVISDAPARQYLKAVKGHAGYHACEHCEQKGEWKEGIGMIYDDTIKPGVRLRTGESFRQRRDKKHHLTVTVATGEGNKKRKLDIGCIFEELEDADIIDLLPLDPMHLCDLGVGKRWMWYLTGKKRLPKSKSKNVIRGDKLTAVNERYSTFAAHTPSEFPRQPDALNVDGKATDFKKFILYTGVALLKGDVLDGVMDSLQLLQYSLRVLSDPQLASENEWLDRADGCLKTFVTHTKNIFTEHFLSYSAHSLLHLTDQVRKNGALDTFSAYISENQFRHMMAGIRQPKLPMEQMINSELRRIAREEKNWPGGGREKQKARQGVRLLKEIKVGGDHDQLQSSFRGCACDSFVLFGNDRDGVVELKIGERQEFYRCLRFRKLVHIDGSVDGRDCIIIARRMRVDMQSELYEYPFPASGLGIRVTQVGAMTRGGKVQFRLSDVNRKVYRMPMKDGRFALVPLLHSTPLTRN